MTAKKFVIIAGMLLLGDAAQAAGSFPDAKISDGIDITNVTVRWMDNQSQLRVSFTLENSGTQPARLNGLTVGGTVSTIVVGENPLDPSGPGLLMQYDEELDFSTSHLVATVPANEITPEDLDHILVEMEIDGITAPVLVHRGRTLE